MLKTSGQIADEVIYALYKMAAPPAAAPAAAPMSFPKAPAPAPGAGLAAGQAGASMVLNRPHQTGPNPAQAAQLQRRGF